MSERAAGKEKSARPCRGAPLGNRNAVGNAGGSGAPSKYDPELHPDQAFKFALLGLTERQIAGVLGISEVTLNTWKKAHPEFAEALHKGKEPADAEVAHSLYERARSGDPQASRYWLNNRRRHSGQWGDRIEHTGADGGPIATTVAPELPWEVMSRTTRALVIAELEAERERLMGADDDDSDELGAGELH